MKDLIFSNEYFYDEVRDGFYIPEIMKRYWAAQLEVLKVIDDICAKYNIKWFANYGTMLGAVRHKGYIPWDDDVDITMLRPDYDRFFEIAEKELPEGFCILTTESQEEYAYPFGRITNSRKIDFSPEHLKKNHGCPYIVGIDIYPYDNLFDDEKLEDERRKRGQDIFQALNLLTAYDRRNKELDSLIRKIENDNHVSFNNSKRLDNQLAHLLESLSVDANGSATNEIGLVYSWIRYHSYKFPSDLFDDLIEMPFECTTVPIPRQYDEALTILFKDYMKPVMAKCQHNYPLFKEQEELCKAQRRVNTFRFTMDPNKLPKSRTMHAPSDHKGKDILFLPCRIEWWDSMKPVFEDALADENNTVSIVPIPHFDCDYMANIGPVHNNANDFTRISDIQKYITTFEEYGLGKRRPDVMVIQVPYDAHSCALTVPEILYSDNLVRFTDELAYVPCFDTMIPESEDSRITASLQYLIEQPALVNADRIILKHPKIKETYLNTLVSLTSPADKEYWESKLCLLSEVEWCKF